MLRLLVGLAGFIILPGLFGAAPPCSLLESRLDTALLAEARIHTDGAGLLAFFKQSTASEEQGRRFALLIRQLGASTFAERQQAEKQLRGAGLAAAPFLRRACDNPDVEIARRANRCWRALGKKADPNVVEAAARVLLVRNPAETWATLLAYLPHAPDDRAYAEILRCMAWQHASRVKADPSVRTALNAPAPRQRAAAAYILGEWRKPPVAPLLHLRNDRAEEVRLHAAGALIKGGDKRGVPTLIGLLADAPLPLAWRAEGLLLRLAGEGAPLVALQGTPASRRACQAAWKKWWQTNQDKLYLTGKAPSDFSGPLILYTELILGRVVVMDFAGKERWHMDDLDGPADVQVLSSGRLLITENHGQRITERDRQGRILWKWRETGYPVCSWRLDNGHTFVVNRDALLEVTPEGKTAWTMKWQGVIHCGRPLRDGGIVLLAKNSNTEKDEVVFLDTNLQVTNRIVFEDPAGPATSVMPLPNGHLLLAGQIRRSQVAEIDLTGKTVWSVFVPGSICAVPLPTGEVVISSPENKCVRVLDPIHRRLRDLRTKGRPWHLQVLP